MITVGKIKIKNIVLVLIVFCFLFPLNKLQAQDKKYISKQVALRHDNDVFRFKHITDKYYSFGLIFNYTVALKNDGVLKKSFIHMGFNENQKIVFDNMIYLKGFTPEFEADLQAGQFRPFAGILNWEPSFYLSNEKRIWRFGALFGVRGKISGAEWVQDNFHDFISDPKFDGWRYQLPNKFLFGANASYIKPYAMLNWVDLYSESSLSLGNFQTNLEQGVGLRVGKFNSLNNSSLFMGFLDRTKRNKNEYYFVIKTFGRFILTDATLSRTETIQNIPNALDKKNLQAGYQAAFYVQIGRFGANVSHTRNSTESNFSGKHSFGSLAFSYSFN